MNKHLDEFIKDVAANSSLVLKPGYLFGARSAALFRMLSVVWGDDEASAKLRNKVAAQLEPHAKPAPAEDEPEPRRPRSYPRKGTI